MATSAAYDLAYFDNRSSIVALEPNKKARHASQKKSKLQSFVNGLAKALLGFIILAIILSFIMVRVKLTEMNSTLNSLNDELGILQSENVRLNSELANIASEDKIEEYAHKNGLQEVEFNQIEYFTVDGGDKIEKSDANDGLLGYLGIHIGGDS